MNYNLAAGYSRSERLRRSEKLHTGALVFSPTYYPLHLSHNRPFGSLTGRGELVALLANDELEHPACHPLLHCKHTRHR